MTIWIKLEDSRPEEGHPVLISDGKVIASAVLYKYPSGVSVDKQKFSWTGSGFGGYEWEFDFTPKYCSELPELPE